VKAIIAMILNNIAIENGWKDTDPRITLSVVTGFLIVAISSIWTSRQNKKRKRDKKKAIEMGHVIKAKLVKRQTHLGKREDNESGTYEYVIDGKTKRKSVYGNSVPLTYLSLYYVDSPEKVFSDYDDFNSGYSIAIFLGIGTIILMLYLTGYFANPL